MTLVLEFDDPEVLEEYAHCAVMGGATVTVGHEGFETRLMIEHPDQHFIESLRQVGLFLKLNIISYPATLDESTLNTGKVN